MGILDSQIIKQIQDAGNQINSEIISDLIKSHTAERTQMIGLWEKYKGVVPIISRRFDNAIKINRKLAHDFRGQIIDQVVGYLFGNPLTYGVVKENYTPEQYQKIMNQIWLFNQENNVADLDATTGEFASVCGYASRLLYFDKIGILRAMNIKPWESIFIYDATIEEMQYAIVYYPFDVVEGGQTVKRWKVEFYDKENVTYWFETGNDVFTLDPMEQQNPMPHGFDEVPVIKFLNNNLVKGDFETVESLIDAYDLLNSDIQNELEEFRLAYMAFIGGTITEDELLKARRTGAFSIAEGGDIKFITKNINSAVVESHKKTIRENIYQLSNTVDFNDAAFTGNAESGEARKLKYQGLESKAIKKERKFTKALEDQFELLAFVWNKINIPLNYHDIRIQFSRNLPIDLTYYATVSNKLFGQVSDKTRLSLMPFIGDPDEELEQIEAENTAKGLLLNLDAALVEPSGSF